MSNALVVTDYFILLALHKAILEVKFSDNQTSLELFGSPFLASAANQITEILIAKEAALDIGSSNESWKKWRAIDESRREWGIAIIRTAQHSTIWRSWTDEERKDFARIALSPFTVSEQLLNVFVTQVNHSSQ